MPRFAQSNPEMISAPKRRGCEAGRCLRAGSQQHAGVRRQLEPLAQRCARVHPHQTWHSHTRAGWDRGLRRDPSTTRTWAAPEAPALSLLTQSHPAVTHSQAGTATGTTPGPELQELGDAKLFIHSQQIQPLFSIQEASVWMKRRSALLFSVGKF